LSPATGRAARDRPALVTGASSGLGRALARGLARRGWNLVLSARRLDALERLAQELTRDHSVSVRALAADLARPGGADELADAVVAAGSEPGLLVNNAGVGSFGPWLEADPERELELIHLNVLAPTRLARRLAPLLSASGQGRILNVASVGAFVPGPRMAVYYATKAYLLSWSLALAEEWRGGGLTVTCLCPGPMDTEFQATAGFGREGTARFALTGVDAVAEAGLRGVLAGRALVVPGLPNRLVAFAPRLLPRPWVARLVHRVQRRRVVPGTDDA
jgi:uncharacterized protein